MPQDSPNRRLKKTASIPRAHENATITLPSKATLEEVRVLFEQYTKEIEDNAELSQYSKTIYVDFAGCFVRWMSGAFKPGSRGSTRRKKTDRIWPWKMD